MSFCLYMTKEDMIELTKLSVQQKNQSAVKLKKNSKQPDVENLAESFKPVTT